MNSQEDDILTAGLVGAIGGAVLGLFVPFSVGIIAWSYVDDFGLEVKLAVALPVLCLGMGALLVRAHLNIRSFLVSAAGGWLVSGAICVGVLSNWD